MKTGQDLPTTRISYEALRSVRHAPARPAMKNASTEYEDPKSPVEVQSNIDLMHNQM